MKIWKQKVSLAKIAKQAQEAVRRDQKSMKQSHEQSKIQNAQKGVNEAANNVKTYLKNAVNDAAKNGDQNDQTQIFKIMWVRTCFFV